MALWKGSIGTGVLCGIMKVSEIVIADVFGLPRSVVHDGSSAKFWRHIYLKASAFMVASPFIIASFIETVRSSTGFNLEDTKIFDVVFRGFDRLKGDLFGTTKDSNRRFSVFYLTLPTVVFNTSRFMISNIIYDRVYAMARRYVSRKSVMERTRFHSILPELLGVMVSTALSDLILYPFETVINRMYIQGELFYYSAEKIVLRNKNLD
jgi:solute carrier family 25 protein 46